ncbi:MAG: flagellar hook-associated protein 1 FlgK [Candidatus Frackibacter sp. T328-2]|nr:MAG: flagellar hook-associated protein 1 FlgK [Candidatus Frackibacter sp. T328-2]
MDLSAAIKNDLNKIAAASKYSDTNGDGKNDYAGDGSNALKLADLGGQKLFNSGTATFNSYYSSNIAQLGVDSQRAKRMVNNQEVLTRQLNKQRDSISGVSLDEEMAKMIKYQTSYSAAAKFVSTMDEILGVLVNGIKR